MPSAARHPSGEQALTRVLRRVRRSARRTLVARALLTLLAGAAAALVALGLIDYLLRLPAWIRWTHLLVGAAAIAYLAARRVWPAARFRPSLSTIALRIEALRPESRDRLASAVELEGATSDPGELPEQLTTLARLRAMASAPLEAASGVVDHRPALRAGAAALAALAVIGAIALAAPEPAETAAWRTLAPWAGAEWPKRTDVEDLTTAEVLPRNEPAPLRAALVRSTRAPEQTDVSVRTRVLEGGEVIDRQRLLAGWQRRGATAGDGREGELFEVLVEGSGDALEYRFETADDQTPWRTIELVERPAVASAEAEIRRPAYLAATAPPGEPDAITVDLGRGLDERAAAPSSLEGSTVRAILRLNKPVPTRFEDRAWRVATLGEGGAELEGRAIDGGAAWELAFDLSETRRLELNLVDEHGVESAERAVFRFPVARDQPPSAVVLDPAHDATVLPQAVVDVLAAGRDDVGLAGLWASAQRYAPEGEAASGRGGAMAPAGEARMLRRAAVEAGDLEAEVRSSVTPADLGAEPGDEVRLWATAADVFGFQTGQREPTKSAERRLLIVSEEEFVEQVRGSLTAVRREAIRLFEEQREAAQRAEGEVSPSQARREQASVSREIERQVERLEGLRERIGANRLDDAALEGLTREAQEIAERAAEAAQDAAEAAGAVDPDQPESEASQEAREEAAQQRERTLDDLSDLIALLDSGEDAWTARRNLERLVEEQREALDATRELSRSTAGLRPEELSPEQREELERIAGEQQELADQAREASRELREAEEKLREEDPATSSALSQAAQNLERSDTSGTMQEAAQEASENRTARAAGLQQQALEQLEEALEQLDEAERSRAEQLRRLALSLVETIEGLVETQREELVRLEARAEGLDRSMIALHTRTVAAQQAALAERELRPVARPLEDAAAAQLEAATTLRREPVDFGAAEDAERVSLEELERALAEAQRLQEQIEQEAVERERQELEQAYRAALETQIQLRDQTQAAAPEGRVDRRARLELRRIAAQQAELGTVIDDLYAQTQELADAIVFRFAHGKLESAIDEAEARLLEAEATQAIRGQERAIALLRGLVEALERSPNEEQDFEDGGGGGGGGGQQGGQQELIPSGAQLKLLRAIQIDVLDRTREADEGQAAAGDLESLAQEQRELSQLGQELIDELTAPPAPGGPGEREAPEGGAP